MLPCFKRATNTSESAKYDRKPPILSATADGVSGGVVTGLYRAPAVRYIGSSLADETVHWRCHFRDDEVDGEVVEGDNGGIEGKRRKRRSGSGSSDEEDDEQEEIPPPPSSHGTPGVGTPLLKLNRSRGGQSTPQTAAKPASSAPPGRTTPSGPTGPVLAQRHRTPAPSTAPTATPVAFDDHTSKPTTQDPSSSADPAPSGAAEELVPRSALSAIARRRLLEPYAVNFVVTVKSRLEEVFIC